MTLNIKKFVSSSLLACSLATLCVSCDKWIDDAKTPQNTLRRDQINEPSMLGMATITKNDKGVVTGIEIKNGPLTAYLQTLVGEANAETSLALGAMTDELSLTPRTNVQLYRELKLDILQINGSSSSRVWDKLHNLRARAQEILEVQAAITGDDEKTAILKAYGKFIGNLYLGYSYHLLANTFSSDVNKEASIRVSGQMKSHSELRAEALKCYNEALKVAQSADFKKVTKGVITSEQAIRQAYGLILKLKLHEGKYDEVASLWGKVYKDKEAYTINYSEQGATNGIYSVIGVSSLRDAQIDPNLRDALRNMAEKKKLPVLESSDKFLYTTAVAKYSPIVLIDDMELQLIKAELIVRGNMDGDALAAVNDVIRRYDAASVETESPTLETISHLRRVYLSFRGERTMDFRRGFVTDPAKKQEWEKRRVHYLPMPELEYKN